jgi:hypothetical protein
MSEENQNQDFEGMIQQNPSIKVTKNTKGYNFEFKILSTDVEEMDSIHNLIVEKIKKWEENES